MRIERPAVGDVAKPSERKSGPVATQSEPARAAATGVVVSRQVAVVREAASRQAEVTAGQVEALRAKVASGTYRVDIEKLAHRIVDDELARGRRK
jgi:flagellar biosynthesis anti-sigma factor FlgM